MEKSIFELRLPHIGFSRIPDSAPEKRQKHAYGGRPYARTDRPQHANHLVDQVTESLVDQDQVTSRTGIDPQYLRVFQVTAIANAKEVREHLEKRLGAEVVDEIEIPLNGGSGQQLTVNFRTEASINNFNSELSYYSSESDISSKLTKKQRNEFFDQIHDFHQPRREDRIGRRLRSQNLSDSEFLYLDVDIWHPGQGAVELLDELKKFCKKFHGVVEDSIITQSLMLLRVKSGKDLCDQLLELPIVARVDLPTELSIVQQSVIQNSIQVPTLPSPDSDTPIVCVLDSGVVAGHPLLAGWVLEEQDFGSGEDTEADLVGHGTAVASIVVHGPLHEAIDRGLWTPTAQVLSAKILYRENGWGQEIAAFPADRRPESIIAEVIREYHEKRNCRIFNLSIQFPEVYEGGHQFPLATILDELVRELDIIIVTIAGNVSLTDLDEPADVATREMLLKWLQQQVHMPQHRISNPGTSSLSLTVGSISRHDSTVPPSGTISSLQFHDKIVVVPQNAPSVLSRSGPGYSWSDTKQAIKPDFVDYGGGIALRQVAGGDPIWHDGRPWLGEPVARWDYVKSNRLLSVTNGTSIAAPAVANSAARACRSLEESLGSTPTANLVRALLASSAKIPSVENSWLLDSENDRLRAYGYGLIDRDEIAYSTENCVKLVASSEIQEGKFHVYDVPVPTDFIRVGGERDITIALAFDPPVRSTRKEYLSRTMWFLATHGLGMKEIEYYKGKHKPKAKIPPLPQKYKIEMRPTATSLAYSTLQVAKKQWVGACNIKTAEGDEQPVIRVLVGCDHRFPTGDLPQQKYGLVVSFRHSNASVRLYDAIRSTVRVDTQRVTERVRGRIRR